MWTAPGTWPWSHSLSSRTSTSVASPRWRIASACGGLTSGISERASRRRSAYDFGIWYRMTAVVDVLSPVGRQGGWAVDGRRRQPDGEEPAVTPAGDTRRTAGQPSFLGLRGRRVHVGDRFLERVERQHRALQAGGADVDPEEFEEIVGAKGGYVGKRLALDLVGQQRRARLADRAAAAGEPDPVDDAVPDAEHHRDPIAAERVRALVARRGRLDHAEVVRPPVVLEDVVAVEIVHRFRI